MRRLVLSGVALVLIAIPTASSASSIGLDLGADPPSEGVCDAAVAPADDLQSALTEASPGARVCLTVGAVYRISSPLRPKDGQMIVGPAAIVGEGLSKKQDVMDLKTGHGTGAVDVTLVDLDISGAGRNGVGCWIGTTILGGRIHDNPKNGVGCDLEGATGRILIDGAEIDHNGSVENLGWGAAGVKWFHTNGATITNSHVHSNIGNGVWCDGNCGDLDVVGNLIELNTRKGVFFEKGGGSQIREVFFDGFATITDNVIQNNNLEQSARGHAGVSIIASKNVLIDGNTFGGNYGEAIHIRNDEDRLIDDKPGYVVANITVTANILNGERIVGCSLVGVECSDDR